MLAIIGATALIITLVVCFFYNKSRRRGSQQKHTDMFTMSLINKLEERDKKKVLEHLELADIDLPYHVGRIYMVG